MELDITKMFEDRAEMWALSGSEFELGSNAGPLTWNNSLQYAQENPLLTPEQIDEVRDYFQGFGAWTKEEIESWLPHHVQGMMTQEIASRLRELEAYEDDDGEVNWAKYRTDDEDGRISGGIYQHEGKFYVYIGV